MATYRIIGSDRNEYGPVSGAQIQTWIADGRANDETPVLVEGELEWKRLGDVPELKPSAVVPKLTVCPRCGEPFEKGFDSCWKCGTGRDGSPPRFAPQAVADQSELQEPAEGPCPKCGSQKVVSGRLLSSDQSSTAIFRPDTVRFFSFSLLGGVPVASDPGRACLDCGLIWAQADPEKLAKFVSTHCRP